MLRHSWHCSVSVIVNLVWVNLARADKFTGVVTCWEILSMEPHSLENMVRDQ